MALYDWSRGFGQAGFLIHPLLDAAESKPLVIGCAAD
jgi:hypothetical protein